MFRLAAGFGGKGQARRGASTFWVSATTSGQPATGDERRADTGEERPAPVCHADQGVATAQQAPATAGAAIKPRRKAPRLQPVLRLWLCGPTLLKVRNQIIWYGKRSLARRNQWAYRGSGSCIARGSPYPNRRSFTLRCKRETGEPGAGDLYAGIYGGRGHKTRRP